MCISICSARQMVSAGLSRSHYEQVASPIYIFFDYLSVKPPPTC